MLLDRRTDGGDRAGGLGVRVSVAQDADKKDEKKDKQKVSKAAQKPLRPRRS